MNFIDKEIKKENSIRELELKMMSLANEKAKVLLETQIRDREIEIKKLKAKNTWWYRLIKGNKQ